LLKEAKNGTIDCIKLINIDLKSLDLLLVKSYKLLIVRFKEEHQVVSEILKCSHHRLSLVLQLLPSQTDYIPFN